MERFDNIMKSPKDGNSYRGLKLDNGLMIFLISDPTTDTSAVSLEVGVGEYQ